MFVHLQTLLRRKISYLRRVRETSTRVHPLFVAQETIVCVFINSKMFIRSSRLSSLCNKSLQMFFFIITCVAEGVSVGDDCSASLDVSYRTTKDAIHCFFVLFCFLSNRKVIKGLLCRHLKCSFCPINLSFS